jgi:hypothetical protein
VKNRDKMTKERGMVSRYLKLHVWLMRYICLCTNPATRFPGINEADTLHFVSCNAAAVPLGRAGVTVVAAAIRDMEIGYIRMSEWKSATNKFDQMTEAKISE